MSMPNRCSANPAGRLLIAAVAVAGSFAAVCEGIRSARSATPPTSAGGGAASPPKSADPGATTAKSATASAPAAGKSVAPAGTAAKSDRPEPKDPPKTPSKPFASSQRATRMDYGPFLAQTVTLPGTEYVKPDGLALRGVVVRLGPVAGPRAGVTVRSPQPDERVDASVVFDQGLLSMRCGWAGWLKITGTPFDGTHRPPEKSRPQVQGEPVFLNPAAPGWCTGDSPDFKDPRTSPFDALPREAGRYLGLYRHGGQVVFEYEVGGRLIREMQTVRMPSPPAPGKPAALPTIVRQLHIGPGKTNLWMSVAHAAGEPVDKIGTQIILGKVDDDATVVVAEGGTGAGTMLQADAPSNRIVLLVRGSGEPTSTEVCITRGKRSEHPRCAGALKVELPGPDQLAGKAGPALWKPVVETPLVPGADTDAYTVDTLTLPDENPWNSWMRPGGVDFLPDGRVAICTWSGDVWIAEGADGKTIGAAGGPLAGRPVLRWRRFASGLHQPLGLRVVGGVVHCLCRDQVVALHDIDGDGEADHHRCITNAVSVTGNFHEFALDLHTDAGGNFVFTKGAPLLGTMFLDDMGRHNGTMVRVSPDGAKVDVLATGLRAPNGSAVGPRGELTCSDNEGIWMPACPLNWINPGGFYGLVGAAHRDPPPKAYDRPLLWIPHAKYIPGADNSGGGQAWSPAGDRWGPLSDRLLHVSYGTCSLYLVMPDIDRSPAATDTSFPKGGTPNGIPRAGAIVRFPLQFLSGIMRARFNPADGQLYLCGLKGWQTTGTADGCLQRVRHTGKPFRSVTGFRATAKGVELTFSTPLDPKTAGDPDSWGGQRWNYRWTADYGSAEYRVSAPARKGRDDITVKSAKLSDDGRTVALEFEDPAPAMQVMLRWQIKSADGSPIRQEIWGTIHSLP